MCVCVCVFVGVRVCEVRVSQYNGRSAPYRLEHDSARDGRSAVGANDGDAAANDDDDVASDCQTAAAPTPPVARQQHQRLLVGRR